mgnify:CR=1 FL=1
MLTEQEVELDELIVADAEAFIDMKNEMESNIAVLSDQIQFLEAIHQLNEVSTFGLLSTIVLNKIKLRVLTSRNLLLLFVGKTGLRNTCVAKTRRRDSTSKV